MLLSTIFLFGALASCAKSDDSGEARGCVAAEELVSPVEPSGESRIAIALEAADDRFVPRCIELSPGGEATFVVRNSGNHPHNVTLPDDERVSVDAGQVAFLPVALDDLPLRFVCTIHPGMEGEIRAAG